MRLNLNISYKNSINLNLFENYRQLSTSEIHMYAVAYVNKGTRQKQNNDQLYHFMENPLTASVTAKIIAEIHKYHIGRNPCRVLLLNIITQK